MIKFFKNMEIYNIYFFKKKKHEFLAKKIHFNRSKFRSKVYCSNITRDSFEPITDERWKKFTVE